MTTMRSTATVVAWAVVAAACIPSALAQDQGTQELDAEPSEVNREQPIAVADPRFPAARSDGLGSFKLGGAIRARYDWRFNHVSLGGAPKASERFNFDMFALKATYESDTIFGAAQYRFLGGSSFFGRRGGYQRYLGEVHFPVWAYVGYKLTPENSITFGLNQTPFGLTPTFGTSFLATLGFAMGVEEVYNFGVKYSHVENDFNYQFGFYPGAPPNAGGITRDSARFSTAVVLADPGLPFGVNNAERNIFAGRAEYFVVKNDFSSLAFGASLWHSEIYNFDTRRTGTKNLGSVHVLGTSGPWGFKGIYVRQDIDPRNPSRNDLVTVGNFDSSYNVAARGNLLSAEVTYKTDEPIGPFTVVPYLGYSTFLKDKADFLTSERYMLGGAWTLTADPSLKIFTEVLLSRNDPLVGAGQFANGLAMGGDNRWKSRFLMNIGYYF